MAARTNRPLRLTAAPFPCVLWPCCCWCRQVIEMKPLLKFDHGMKEKPVVTNIEKRINVEMKNITIPRLMNDTTSEAGGHARGLLVGGASQACLRPGAVQGP